MLDTPPQASPAHTAGRLKYADPRSLPSFPSHGLSPDGAAASAAATLGWANQKPIEPWKPDETSSAFAAAVLAKNYKMSPAWEPTSSSAGAQAALLAVGSADAALKRANSTTAVKGPHDGWGNSAATQAFHAPGQSAPQQVNLSHGSSAATQAFAVNRSASVRKPNVPATSYGDKSLAAAKGAMSLSRPRAISSPSAGVVDNSSQPAASNALNGATLAHRASLKPKAPSNNAGAVPVTTMTRNMFTSHPMVQPEVDEQQRNQELRESAIVMARKMYSMQQKEQSQSTTSTDGQAKTASPYVNLQEAAYKQAQERLAKLHDEHEKTRQYQEYYGNTQTSPKRRFSMAGKLRRRSSSDSDVRDQQQSQRIRQQMSMFSNKLSQVDSNKRDKDREALLAAAQRNVKAKLQGMDEKAQAKSGHTNTMSDWEVKAHHTAQLRSEDRNVNKGKIDIGGGKFMDSDEVDAIASKRVQPVLDDINEKAENERERLAALKLEEEARKAEQERQKTRERELKEITKKAKEEEKQEERAKRQQEKQEENKKKEQEKAAKAEQKKMAKDEKRKSRLDTFKPTLHQDRQNDTSETRNEDEAENLYDADTPNGEPRAPALAVVSGAGADTSEAHATTDASRSPTSPTSPTSKVKGWIRNRFSRGKSMSEGSDKKKGFLGGVALRQEGGSTTSLDNRPTSMREVAMAGRNRDSQGVSVMSSASSASTERYDDAAMVLPQPLEDPAIRKSSSPNRDSRFREMMTP